jgi:hypothetical protein
MMNSFRFGTAINCMDGRTQLVVIDHMKQNYNIDGVDMVTYPGADGLFSNRVGLRSINEFITKK